MPASIYTKTEHEFIRKHYPLKGAAWVAKKTGKRVSQIKAYVKNHKITRLNYRMSPANAAYIRENIGKFSYQELARATGESSDRIKGFVYKNKLSSKTWYPYTEEQKAFIVNNFRSMSYKELAEATGRHKEGIRHFVRENLKLRRTNEEIRALYLKFSSSQYFKKGHLPTGTKFNGYISIRKDRHGNLYKHIRIAPGKFDLLHRHNWELKHGPIPEGKILRSVNGDSLNCEAENWELIDKADNLELNAGRRELTDNYIARTMARERQGRVNRILIKDILAIPEVIELKRTEIKLRREINAIK